MHINELPTKERHHVALTNLAAYICCAAATQLANQLRPLNRTPNYVEHLEWLARMSKFDTVSPADHMMVVRYREQRQLEEAIHNLSLAIIVAAAMSDADEKVLPYRSRLIPKNHVYHVFAKRGPRFQMRDLTLASWLL